MSSPQLLLVAVVVMASASPARAVVVGDASSESGGTNAGTTQPKQEPGSGTPPDLAPSQLDFNLLGAPKEKADPALQHRIEMRRTMLTLHQGFGIATLAALAATTIVGQLDFNDRFRGGGDTGKYHGWHAGLAYGTSALFLTTGLLALLAPKPYPKPVRLDTALLHKIAMGTAAAGMITQIVLGIVSRGQAGSVSERNLATAHQIVGYATLGAMTTGVVVLFF